MKRIKVLYIIESLSQGGAERRLINDLKFMDRHKVESAVCVLSGNVFLEKEIVNLGVAVYRMSLKKLADYRGIFRLMKLIKTVRPDIVHTQLFWSDILGRIAAKLTGVPVVISTIQSSAYEPGNSYLFSRKRKLLDSLTGKLFNNKYIAVSKFVKKSIIRRLGIKENKISVIYNCLDFSDFYTPGQGTLQELKNGLGLSGNDFILAVVGRLNPPKGHRFIFEALSILKPRFPNLKLLIIGDGPSRQELAEYAGKLGIEKEIIFLGVRDDVKNLLAISDIFVFPTLSEGMPLSLLEAMAMRKPCIASAIEPIKEVIEDKNTGYLFPPGDSQGLAAVLENILKAPGKMDETAMRGAEFTRKRFDASAAADELAGIYEELAMIKRAP